MNKLIDWKNRLKKGHMFSIIVGLLIVVAILGFILYKKQREYKGKKKKAYGRVRADAPSGLFSSYRRRAKVQLPGKGGEISLAAVYR